MTVSGYAVPSVVVAGVVEACVSVDVVARVVVVPLLELGWQWAGWQPPRSAPWLWAGLLMTAATRCSWAQSLHGVRAHEQLSEQ